MFPSGPLQFAVTTVVQMLTLMVFFCPPRWSQLVFVRFGVDLLNSQLRVHAAYNEDRLVQAANKVCFARACDLTPVTSEAHPSCNQQSLKRADHPLLFHPLFISISLSSSSSSPPSSSMPELPLEFPDGSTPVLQRVIIHLPGDDLAGCDWLREAGTMTDLPPQRLHGPGALQRKAAAGAGVPGSRVVAGGGPEGGGGEGEGGEGESARGTRRNGSVADGSEADEGGRGHGAALAQGGSRGSGGESERERDGGARKQGVGQSESTGRGRRCVCGGGERGKRDDGLAESSLENEKCVALDTVDGESRRTRIASLLARVRGGGGGGGGNEGHGDVGMTSVSRLLSLNGAPYMEEVHVQVLQAG